jgi:4-hydroxybenzoate polyprenyltransferase/phosphoserine phosphatase
MFIDKGIAPVLVVDLDGTLLRSDVLAESFLSAVGRDWRNLFRSLTMLFSGRAQLKRYLTKIAPLDVPMLPYDPVVMAYVRDWRSKGGRTALVTASDQTAADQIADHLGLFDEVHGSDGNLNLKGAAKANFLTDRFGTEGFAYIGDANADLPVWRAARKAITINASQALKTQVEQLGTDVEHLRTTERPFSPYFMALRPHQWLKNILVFLPMLTAHQLDATTLLQSTTAFIAFSLVASSVYVLNDLLDLAADRAHPRKRLRPFASGSVPISDGAWMASGLLTLGITISLLLGWQFALVMLAYFALTTAYSTYLKRLVVIDICVLAGLYTMRIVAGGFATGIQLSMWLLGFSIFFFFSLAAVKRQAELVDSIERGKLNTAGRGYQVADVPIVSMIALGAGYVSVLVLALYVNSPSVRELYVQPRAFAGICGVLLYWVTYVVMMTHRGAMHDDPLVFAAKDRNSQICFLFVLAFAAAGVLL